MWTVKKLERLALVYLADSNLPSDYTVVLYLFRDKDRSGRLAFSTGVAGRNSSGDPVGSW
jgi:hypothetical protein